MPLSTAISRTMSNELHTESQVENETNEDANLVDDQTVEGSDASGVDDVKKEDQNEYKQRLVELEAQLKERESQLHKKDEALKNKNRAINALKKAAPEPEDDDVDALTEKVTARIEASMRAREAAAALREVSSDPDEQKLVKFHYDNSIKQSGDVQRDLKAALALANADKLYELRQAAARGEAREEEMASLAASMAPKPQPKSTIKTREMKLAESFLDAVAPEAKKYLSNHLQ